MHDNHIFEFPGLVSLFIFENVGDEFQVAWVAGISLITIQFLQLIRFVKGAAVVLSRERVPRTETIDAASSLEKIWSKRLGVKDRASLRLVMCFIKYDVEMFMRGSKQATSKQTARKQATRKQAARSKAARNKSAMKQAASKQATRKKVSS